MALTRKRQVFVNAYLETWNATEAAKRAGYSERTAYAQGHRLLKNAEIQSAIQARLAELKMGADEVLLRLAEQARAEYADYLRKDGTVDLERLLADGKGHLIKGTKWDRQDNLIVEFYDAHAALVDLGKHLGLFREVFDVRTIDLSVLSDEQLERIANGEDLLAVLATSSQGRAGTPATQGGRGDGPGPVPTET